MVAAVPRVTSQEIPDSTTIKRVAMTAFMTLSLLASMTTSVSAMDGMRSHGITNFQSTLRKHSTSSLSPRSRAFLTVKGGSSAQAEQDVDTMAAEDIESSNTDEDSPADAAEAADDAPSTDTIVNDEILDVAEDVEEVADPSTSTAEAATGLASLPLRISTSQMGNEIVTNDIKEFSRAKKRMARREKRQARRKLKKEEKSHKKYAKKLKNRNSLNIGRKVMHAACGFWFAFLNQVIPKDIFLPFMTFISTGTFGMECLRYRKGFGWMNDCLNFCLGGTLRKHEMEGKFTGSFYYFLGTTIAIAAFPGSCASLGIIQLALADPSASYFGRMTKNVYWSRIENGFFGLGRNKGVLGFLGGALVCVPFNFYALSIAKFHTAKEVTNASIALASLGLGLAGAFADLCVPTPALTMPKKICGVPMLPLHVDDNIVVPIFSAYACTKIFDYLGWGASGVELAKYLVI